MPSSALSERRAGDRAKMAAAVESLVQKCGAAFVRTQAFASNHREVGLYITAPGGLQVRVCFDGKSPQPDVYVLSWHMDSKSKKRLNDATFGGQVNPYHFQKATYVAYGFDDLCNQLEAGLNMAQDGTAFLPEMA